MTRRATADPTTTSAVPLADVTILSQRRGLEQVDRLNPLHVALWLAIGEAAGEVGPTAAGLTARDFHDRALDELRGLASLIGASVRNGPGQGLDDAACGVIVETLERGAGSL